MTVVRAPATTANLGAGFDCAAVALELWNELEVTDGAGVAIEGEGAEELPADEGNLAVRAYALLADPAGKRFRFRNDIPLERGLGSSAAAIALGLAAGLRDSNSLLQDDLARLLALGLQLESHADNLAAALAGGATLTDGVRVHRLADSLPLTPVAIVPDARTATDDARAALPAEIAHADAAFSAARAAFLGAGLASGRADLLTEAFGDRLHEPYRRSPMLGAVRERLPAGAAGATLSGSGPTVIVWARDAGATATELRQRFPGERVLVLGVAEKGAL